MNQRISLFISIIFHPVIINLLGLIVLILLAPVLQFGMNDRLKFFYFIFIFSITGIIPVLAVFILKFSGNIKSFFLQEKEERTIPYIITSILYLFTYYFCLKLHTQPLIVAYLLACSTITVAVLLINIKDKISIHLASFGALTAIVTTMVNVAAFDIRILLAIILFFAGLTGTARMFANSHKSHQLVSGFLLGFLIMYFII